MSFSFSFFLFFVWNFGRQLKVLVDFFFFLILYLYFAQKKKKMKKKKKGQKKLPWPSICTILLSILQCWIKHRKSSFTIIIQKSKPVAKIHEPRDKEIIGALLHHPLFCHGVLCHSLLHQPHLHQNLLHITEFTCPKENHMSYLRQLIIQINTYWNRHLHMLTSLRVLKDRFDIYESLCRKNLFKRFKILVHVKLATPYSQLQNYSDSKGAKQWGARVSNSSLVCSEETTPLKNRGSSSIKIGDGGRLNKLDKMVPQKKIIIIIPKEVVSKYIGRLNT